MTRTVDAVAANRPQTAGAVPIRNGSSRRLGRLSSVLVALLLATALVSPTTVFAVGSTTKENGYSQTPKPKGAIGTSPVKEKSSATKATGPSTSTGAPAKSSAPASESAPAKTLPFTGLDLRLMAGVGFLLIVAGASIVGVQRRQRLVAVQRRRRHRTRR